jgi:hypothetical protein
MLIDKDNEVEKEYGGVRIEYNPEAGVRIILLNIFIFISFRLQNT